MVRCALAGNEKYSIFVEQFEMKYGQRLRKVCVNKASSTASTSTQRAPQFQKFSWQHYLAIAHVAKGSAIHWQRQ